MDLPPFLLDRWLAAHEFADPPIRFNLASSTGPRWKLDEILNPRTLDATVLGYAPPDGSPPLRTAIATLHGCEARDVVATTGASEALSILFCLLEKPGGNVVLPRPGYPAYDAMAGAWRLRTRHYDVSAEHGFVQTAADVLAAVDPHTVGVIVNTPHNPVGSAMPAADIRVLAAELSARGIPLIVDEVYHPLYFGPGASSAAGIDGVIAIGDLSKAYSLPGLRTGWIIDRNPVRRERIVDARSYFTISGSPLLEAVATAALLRANDLRDRITHVATRNCQILAEAMTQVGFALDWVRPDGGTTAFPWFKDGRDSRPFCEDLARAGVLIAPGDCFGLPNHFRVGLGQEEHGFQEAIEILIAKLRTMARFPVETG